MIGIHGGLAMLSGREEWSLDTQSPVFDGKTESAFLSQSIADVAKHYGNGVLDQKTVDWLNLMQCLGIVYGARIWAIRSNPRQSKQRAPTPSQAARTFNPAPSNNEAGVHRTAPPVNNFSPPEPPVNVNIAGVGDVEFGPDNPLHPEYRKVFN